MFPRKSWQLFLLREHCDSSRNSQVSVGAPAHLAPPQELRSGGLCPEKENNQLDQWVRDWNIKRAETKRRSQL
jgi:hypothetical protein